MEQAQEAVTTNAASDISKTPQKFILIEIPKLSKEQIEAAKAFNFPLDKLMEALNNINLYANTVEARFAFLEQTMADAPKKVVEELKAEALKRQKEMAQQMQNVPQAQPSGGGGGAIKTLAQLLPLLGGGSNPMMEKFMDAMIMRSINEMASGSAFDKVFREYMVKKMAKELGEPLVMEAVKTTEAK